jgi:hypothetical protein
MKNRITYSILGLLAIAATACNDAKYSEIDNLVYFSEAASAKSKTVSMTEETVSTSVTVRLGHSEDVDMTANVSVDTAYLNNYNKYNETDWKVPSSEYFAFSNSAKISAGSVSSAPINIEIKNFNTYGVKYAIPLSITSVDGNVKIAESSSKFIIFLSSPLIQPVPKFTWYNKMTAAPMDDWRLELPNYTLEWWSKITSKSGDGGYSTNNHAIFYSGGKNASGNELELYVRFGDLIYSDGWSYKNNFLQVKTLGSQFDTGDPTQGYGLDAGTWYHFAITYEASSGTTTLYKNGEKINTLNTASGQSMWIDRLQIVCSGQQYFPDWCELCQVRLWKTTRTQNQIQNSMYSDVDPSNADLVLYLPMNEGEGTILHDVTGNGHDVEVGNISDSADAKNFTWTTYSFTK